MAEDLIRYDLLVQDALRGVVRKVLGQAAREGLRGDHYFYISFRTDWPGLRISQRLRERYPQEMTIVLQHQFWDLGVTEHAFEVGLSFSGVPERLLVPFEALTGFFDPSVQFGLKFEAEAASAGTSEPEQPKPLVPVPAKGPAPLVPASSPTPLPVAAQPKPEIKPEPKPAAAGPAKEALKDQPKPAAKQDKDADEEARDTGSAAVVSLDAFRKKH